jgi:hypothetical protein
MSDMYLNNSNERSWDGFAKFIVAEAKTTKYGRQALRRRWKHLRDLVKRCAAEVPDNEIQNLLGKTRHSLDPEANDMKALVAYCVGKGLARGEDLVEALQADLDAEPMAFLADHSGKSFGEKWAPAIAKYWLCNDGDRWEKMKAKDYYDIAWTPKELGKVIRIEIKASSEAPEFRFQQIRHPRLNDNQSQYDVLLCVGVTASTLEWWAIPTPAFDDIANNELTLKCQTVFRKHHGKDAPIWNDNAGYEDEAWFCADERCRGILTPYSSGSESIRDFMIQQTECYWG